MSAEFPIPLLMAVDGLLMTPMRVVIASSGGAGGPAFTPYQDNFASVLYRGASATQSISLGFEAGLILTKRRDADGKWMWSDINEGPRRSMEITGTAALASSNDIVSIGATSMLVGPSPDTNTSGGHYISWVWKADESASHATVSKERYNLSTGISLLTYDAGAGGARQLSHSLGLPPKFMIAKDTTQAAGNFAVYHEDVAAANPADLFYRLDTTAAPLNYQHVWNDIEPTSTTWDVGNDMAQAGQSYTAALFTEVSGFSQFGFYIGNGSATGPVISTTFEPGMLIIKNNAVASWQWYDQRRSLENPNTGTLNSDSGQKEETTRDLDVDFNSANFQIKTSNANVNTNSQRYVYAAFKKTWVEPTPEPKFATTLYTGTGVSQSVSVGFQSDFLWIKARDAATNHVITDSVRGPKRVHYIDTFLPEISTNSAVQSIGATGFTVAQGAQVNQTDVAYVAYSWKASTLTTPVSGTVNEELYDVDTGVSVINYTGNGANREIVHSLNRRPDVILCKELSANVVWLSYHVGVDPNDPADYYMRPSEDTNRTNDATAFRDAIPRNYGFELGTNGSINESGKGYMAYLFASVPGFSKHGAYTGNGNNDGPIVSCDFSVGYVLIKDATAIGPPWILADNKRSPTNTRQPQLFPNLPDIEANDYSIEFSQSWLQIRDSHASINTNARTYIYSAFKG